MKQLALIIITAGLLISSCKKADELKYASSDNVYFDFYKDNTRSDRDSIVYTFAFTPLKTTDTVYLPVRISGIRAGVDRKVKISVITDSTTAEAGKHYQTFKSEYIMSKDSGKLRLPVIIYNTDTNLTKNSVTLRFKLVASDDFGVILPGLTTGKLVFSNRLEKPSWWSLWGISNYSQVKFEMLILSTGVSDIPYDPLTAPRYLYYMGLLTSFLNDPAAWIASHPSSGYVLALRADGNYDFYNTANPNKKRLYRKNTQSGKFYFIDENGKEVI